MNPIAWLDKHKGTAAMLGGFCSVTAGATWWLAKGGAVAFIKSMSALSQPDIAETLQDLPAYHERVEVALGSLKDGQEAQVEAWQQVMDTLESLRRETERVVEWAPEHSQRLTDAVGGCVAGEDCTVYFRGRRTQSGASCDLVAAKPRLSMSDGSEYPTSFAPGKDRLDLSTKFETVETQIRVPQHIPPGLAGVVVLTIYADCPFAGEGETVERETFRLQVEIRAQD